MLDNYGIIKGKIKSFETELNMLTEDERRKKGPHYNMILDVNGKDYHVNINIFFKQSPISRFKNILSNSSNRWFKK